MQKRLQLGCHGRHRPAAAHEGRTCRAKTAEVDGAASMTKAELAQALVAKMS